MIRQTAAFSVRPVALLVAFLMGVIAPTVFATSVRADTQWTVAPASATEPDGRISLRHVIDPGASVLDHIAVTNLGSQEATFEVTPGDGVLGADGAFDIAPGEPTDAGAWMAIDGLTDGTVTVPAGGTQILPVTISVPDDATPGDHPAGVTVAVSSGEGVTVTHRIGVRLHLQVAGDIEPKLQAEVTGSNYEASLIPFAPGTLTVKYTVTNVGNVRLGSGTRIEADGLFGLGGDSELVTTEEMLPGDSVTDEVTLDVPPTFIVSGSLEAAGLVVGEDGIEAPAAQSSGFRTMAVSWTGLLVIALVAAGGVWWRLRTRRSTPPGGGESRTSSRGAVS